MPHNCALPGKDTLQKGPPSPHLPAGKADEERCEVGGVRVTAAGARLPAKQQDAPHGKRRL